MGGGGGGVRLIKEVSLESKEKLRGYKRIENMVEIILFPITNSTFVKNLPPN